MSSTLDSNSCDQAVQVNAYVMQALPPNEASAVEAHTHAGLEKLFLLDGDHWIDDRKLYPGDYNRAEAGSGDKRSALIHSARLEQRSPAYFAGDEMNCVIR